MRCLLLALALPAEAAEAAPPTAPTTLTETTVNVSPMGVLGFTLHNIADFALNVEHVRGHHGALLEAAGLHHHGDPTHTTLLGGNLGYRYHFDSGAFIGVIGGFKLGASKYFLDAAHQRHWTTQVRHMQLIPHVGQRWTLGERLCLTARFGAG